ncbi:MAG TPA: prephenate dehydrogenase/arogenate dehydrogenase family protein [Candidatus Eisenbacteria bacterium]|nr:prephenate dehydrogenase/arogenate dehydrogenase family protein [Candidatus Eisenbacteria bacterium]
MTTEGLPNRIAFLGFGLIGGSIAKALRAASTAEGRALQLVAWTPGGSGPEAGLAAGILDEAAADPRAALGGAGLVVLAAPPLDVLDLLDDLAGPLRDALAADVTITDVASTKAAISDRATRRGLPFVGGHPMAGRDESGVGAASAGLFQDRPWVIVPPPGGASAEPHVARVESLARAVGARPVRLGPAEHDSLVAAISHLPLVAAAALVEAVTGSAGPAAAADAGWAEDWPAARRLAASGWRDATRLARGDPAMGAGILATNAGPVVARLRAYRHVLDTWIAELERPSGPDPDELEERLLAVRERLDPPPD